MGSARYSKAPQPPPVFSNTPLFVKQEAQAMTEATRSIWDSIVSNVMAEEASFQSVILPIAMDENRRMERQRILQFFASTSTSKELRDAASETSNMLDDDQVDLYSRRDVFVLVDRVLVMSRDQQPPLDPQSQYFLEKLHRRFVQSGCGIEDEAKRTDFKEKTNRLQHVVRECNRNLSEYKSGLWVTVDNLEGAPKSLIDRFKHGEDEFSGHLWLPAKVPYSQPAVSSSRKESTRRRIHYAVQNRMLSHIPLFRELGLLRDETARSLGFSDHFERKNSVKMARNPQVVEKLMGSVLGPMDHLAKADADELLKLKQQDDESESECKDKLFFWDLSYYTKRRNEKARAADATLREYFELDTTISKLMDMFEHLFRSRFIRVNEDGKEGLEKKLLWHEDVRMYEVFGNDDGGEFLGYAYLDLFPRDGKYTHAGHYALTRVRTLRQLKVLEVDQAIQAYAKEDGRLFHPSSALVMNYAKQTGQPTLLKLNDVRRLFHEMGHLLHSLFTRVKYAGLHHVDRDFVEAPSLMFEQFFWVERHIKEVSHHYSHIEQWQSVWNETHGGEGGNVSVQLSDEVVASLAQSNHRDNTSTQLKEVFFAAYDWLIHTPSTHQELEAMNLTELFNKTRTSTYHIHGGEANGDPDGWEWGHGQTVFRNFINEYDAG